MRKRGAYANIDRPCLEQSGCWVGSVRANCLGDGSQRRNIHGDRTRGPRLSEGAARASAARDCWTLRLV